MKRRELIALLGGSAAAWPLRASAQQPSRTRHIAVLLGGLEQGDVEGLAELAAFNDGLKQAGWNVGANIEVDYRWPGADPNRLRAVANEVADTHPDLVLTRSTPATAPLMSMDLPVVFTLVSDPLGSRFIQSYAKPRRAHHWLHQRRTLGWLEVALTLKGGSTSRDPHRTSI